MTIDLDALEPSAVSGQLPAYPSFCRCLGMTAPVVQAPVGSAATPQLAAAVSIAGGLGMLALTWTAPDAVGTRIRATRELTGHPFGVNLILEWDQRERLRACIEESISVVSTFWGDPAPYVDAVVAQGWEAGGRVRGEVATMPLVRP
jgi:nitronate monooxygenase